MGRRFFLILILETHSLLSLLSPLSVSFSFSSLPGRRTGRTENLQRLCKHENTRGRPCVCLWFVCLVQRMCHENTAWLYNLRDNKIAIFGNETQTHGRTDRDRQKRHDQRTDKKCWSIGGHHLCVFVLSMHLLSQQMHDRRAGWDTGSRQGEGRANCQERPTERTK